ncbi:Spaetzle [Popillia japonica]|uniref:Spaetzle n=1 Tax=Popillia japonica TaxID=7064 RepID=A0AAW1HS12_POPJA
MKLIKTFEARPPLTTERIINHTGKLNITASFKKKDCGNLIKLIHNEHDLFKCLLNIDVHEIVFPDSEENEDEDLLVPTPFVRGRPSCARNGQNFCENIDTYPHRKLQRLLQRNASLGTLFGVDEAPDEFVNRDGVEEDRFLCESEQKLIFPKVGKTKQNKWKYIVNQGDSSGGYVQGVLIRTCRGLDEPCQFAEFLPSGYKATCKQMYVYRKLLSVTRDGVTVNEYFELPSACCCSYTRDFNYLFRNAGNISAAKKEKAK